MADGPAKPIRDVQVGDRVKSRDPLTGVESAKTVTATIKRLAPALVHLSLTDAKTGKSETLTCTPEHPLFVSGRGWVAAGSLGIGSLIVSRAGPLLSVSSLTWEREAAGGADGGGESKSCTVYNLTVEDDHTYFVGTVGGGTWVHNVNCVDRIHIIDENLPQQKLVKALGDKGVNVTSMWKLGYEGVPDPEIIPQLNAQYGDAWTVITKNAPDFPAANVIKVEAGNQATMESIMGQLGPILGF
jgi:hypothetical protein